MDLVSEINFYILYTFFLHENVLFYVSTDSHVNIFCLLNNIVVIALP